MAQVSDVEDSVEATAPSIALGGPPPPAPSQASSAIPSGWPSSYSAFTLPKMPQDGIFTGFNLLQWQRYVTITLKGRLMRHLEDDGPPRSHTTYYNWLDVEGVVHRWLLDSISPSVKGEFLALEFAKAVWEAVLDSHSKKHNIATLYELVHQAANLRQGDRSVLDYSNELMALWAEIDHYMPPDEKSVDRKYTLQLRVFQFLMGLNLEYEQLRGQLVHRETLLFKDVLRSVRMEEARLHQAHAPTTGSAMALQQTPSTRGPTLTTAPPRGVASRADETPRGDSSLVCNYCKKRGHTKETCFKLQRKRAQQANVATVSSSTSVDGVPTPGQVPMPYSLLPPPAAASSTFTSEEVERLRRLLDPPVVGSCSLAHAGMSTALANPPPSTSPSWIVDSGASSHMTSNPRVFTSYDPSPGSSKVRTASGALLTVAGVGRVALTPSLHLSRVLHVPWLAVHLFSLNKLVRDLDHDLPFNSYSCFYRDKVSGRMTTLAKEHQGLYLVRPPPHPPLSPLLPTHRHLMIACGFSIVALDIHLSLLFELYFPVCFMVNLLTDLYVTLADRQNIIVWFILLLLLVQLLLSLSFILTFGGLPLSTARPGPVGWLFLSTITPDSRGLTF